MSLAFFARVEKSKMKFCTPESSNLPDYNKKAKQLFFSRKVWQQVREKSVRNL